MSELGIVQRTATSKFGAWTIGHVLARIDPLTLRLSGGRISTLPTKPILLLRHTGAKSGLRRETSLQFAVNNNSLIVVAANGGQPRHPGWYFNLKANPDCEVIVRHRSGRYVATELTGDDRNQAWIRMLEIFPGYEIWQERAGREFPVFALTSTTSQLPNDQPTP